MGQELNTTPPTWRWANDEQGTIVLGEAPLVLHPRPRLHQPKLRQGVRSQAASEIPFEPQRQTDGQRMCGAAALAMTLRALGVPCTQEELWSEIACLDGEGHWAARTFHLASAALRRAMPALVIQVRDGWKNLERLATDVPGLILNHRLEASSPQGHYSVLVDIDQEAALLHDPILGPRRLVSRVQLETLWQPIRKTAEENEIAGNVLVGIGPRVAHSGRCRQCDFPFPAHITCGNCGQHFPLQPSTVLGCMRSGCGECRWQRLFCPFCDAAFQPVD
jgi:predicted double-glycine peptidase